MYTEFEIKVLEINLDEVRKILKTLGAEYKGKKEFRRYVYDMTPPQKEKWIRLRTDGKKSTLTCKHIIDPNAIDGVKEWEIQVDDFDTTNILLEQIGYLPKAYQENNRESYILNGCEVELDSRPMIPPYLEIEGANKEIVLETLKKLNLSEHITTSENTAEVYKRYNINISDYKHLAFNVNE